MIVKWLVRLLFRKPPAVSKSNAVAIAAEFAQRLGWRTNKPHVVNEIGSWLVWLDSDLVHSQWVAVSKDSGEVVDHGSPRR